MAKILEEQKKTVVEGEEPLLQADDNTTTIKKGGYRTLPFIIANEALEKMATYGLTPNMTFYLMNEYHMGVAPASTLLYIWSAATNLIPFFGALIADSYLGQFHTIGFGSVICLMGMILLWLTAAIPQLRPPACDEGCISPTFFQLTVLCSSLGLVAVGGGAIRSCSLSFGANQLETKEFQTTSRGKESYFSWYYAMCTFSILIALTCLVYIQDHLGWGVGFAVPAVLMVFSLVSFYLASPFYIRLKGKPGLVSSLVQVIVASYRNRYLSETTDVVYYSKSGSDLVFPSEKLRFLNKACILQDPQRDLDSEGRVIDPWSLCTVSQVEDLKSLINIIPIWFSGVIMTISISQNSFPVLQAASLDRHLTKNFEIPAASFNMFVVITVILFVALYDFVFIPLASWVMGRPVRLSTKTKMGLGIFLSFLAMITTAFVENIRRTLAIREGFPDSVPMSALWIVPQFCLLGFAEGANVIGQNEFYFLALPRSMSSIASSLLWIGMSLASLIASVILNVVDSLSSDGGNESWVSSDINKGHYDYYYLVLAGLLMVNMIYFLICSRAYGPEKEERKAVDEGE